MGFWQIAGLSTQQTTSEQQRMNTLSLTLRDILVVGSCGHNRGGNCQQFVARGEICVNCVRTVDQALGT